MELTVLRQSPLPGSLIRDLLAVRDGELRLSRHDRMLYATDASIYQVEPLGVWIPRTVDGAARAVALCAAHGVPVLPRGGGTSLAGQCTARAMVIDTSAHCRAVLEVDADARRARVEPGVTIDQLNEHLASLGGEAGRLFFAPDPATTAQAAIGGCIGNNAAGARSIRFGRTSENVRALDVCLADGTRLHLERGSAAYDERARAITRRVCEVVGGVASLIRERFPKTHRRNAGYNLDLVLFAMERAGWRDGHDLTDGVLNEVNLAQLLCGSEGTLAMTLGAEVILHERPRVRGLAVLAFGTLDAAVDSVVPILATNPTAVELLDDMVLSLAAGNSECRRLLTLIPPAPGGEPVAVLYVEYFADNADELGQCFERLRSACSLPSKSVRQYADAESMLGAWSLRKAGEPLLHGIPGRRKPITFVEDNAVPVEHLARFVREFREIVEHHGTRAAFYAHAGAGVLHVRPLLDLHDPADRQRMLAIALRAAELSASLGGVPSGEHGDGRVRTPLLERCYGAELMEAFRQIKAIFDPRDLFNPGNIVDLSGGNPRPVESLAQNLRADATAPHFERTYFDFSHGFFEAVEACNGAGVCRKTSHGTMCPSYRALLDERHTTRGRANALRLALSGDLGGAPVLNDPETLATLDLCLSCKACRSECPSNVDMAKLKAEYLAQSYERSGAPLGARILGATRVIGRLGSSVPRLAGAMLRPALVRALVGRLLGFHARRSLPLFARSLRHQWGDDDPPGMPRVAVFADCFTSYYEPQTALAARRVLNALGYSVTLLDAGCCARAKISLGLLPQAIREIDRTLDRMRPVLEDPDLAGIVVLEPSCLSAMHDEWQCLRLGSPSALRSRVRERTVLAEDFIARYWDRHPSRVAWQAPCKDVLLHGHCHQKALWGAESSAGALRMVAGARLRVLDSGCCGMAGAFGYADRRFDLSMRIAGLALLPALRANPDATVCAPGTSCRHQIRDATDREAMHPVEFLASLLPG
jgi:FAD/FMN-containing dehydrogenase/Fe-S oxidoreductase